MTRRTYLNFLDNLFAEGADFGGALKGHGRRSFVLRSDAEKRSRLIWIRKIQIRPKLDQIKRILGAFVEQLF